MSLENYIQGKRYGEEANQLEQDAMQDPFLQDAIDGYDRVNDHPDHHLTKLEKQLSKRRKRRRFYFLQGLGIAAAVLLLIGLTIFFFLSGRVNPIKDMNFFQNHTDNVVSNYTDTKNNLSYTPQNVQIREKEFLDSVLTLYKNNNKNEDRVNKKAEATIRKSEDLPVEKNQPAQPATQQIQPTQPAQQVQPVQQTQQVHLAQQVQSAQPKEKIKSEKNRSNIQEEEPVKEAAHQYTLSNEETQALLLEYNKPVETKKTTGNLIQPQPQSQTQSQTQPETPKPAKGNEAYNDYIAQNRQQLEDANCDNQHGKVILMFHVNKQGRPTDIAILRSLCPAADREAVRLLQNGPNWTVGDQAARLEVAF